MIAFNFSNLNSSKFNFSNLIQQNLTRLYSLSNSNLIKFNISNSNLSDSNPTLIQFNLIAFSLIKFRFYYCTVNYRVKSISVINNIYSKSDIHTLHIQTPIFKNIDFTLYRVNSLTFKHARYISKSLTQSLLKKYKFRYSVFLIIECSTINFHIITQL